MKPRRLIHFGGVKEYPTGFAFPDELEQNVAAIDIKARVELAKEMRAGKRELGQCDPF